MMRNKIQTVVFVAVVVVTFSFIRFLATTLTYLTTTVDNEDCHMRTAFTRCSIDDRLPKLSVDDPASEMNAIPAPEYHLVISTGCSTFQDWQSYAMFWSAYNSGQVQKASYVTRVVSGCSEAEKIKMNELHKKIIEPIAPRRFFIHHTPLYQFVKPNVNYVYFNKAFGYQHWMVNALRYPYNHEKYDNVTYILLDPDQLLMRPFKDDFTNENEQWGGPFTDKRRVERGQPFAQKYEMGIDWLLKARTAMEKIAPHNELPSPVTTLSNEDATAYEVGPPYLMKGYDLWNLVNKWVEFNPYVYELYPDHMSEMFAYSIAAAHLKLPHQLAHTFMVSNTDVDLGEGWSLIEEKSDEDVCTNVPVHDIPHVLHFCQHYGLGKYFFSKYKLPTDFISCRAPLLREPPHNIAAKYDYILRPNGQRRGFNTATRRRNAFALCHMIRMMNQAATYYKQHHCAPGQANLNKSLVFHDIMDD